MKYNNDSTFTPPSCSLSVPTDTLPPILVSLIPTTPQLNPSNNI